VALIAIVLAIAWASRAVVLPFVLALLVAYILAPPVSWLERKGVPRWAGVLICYLLIFGSLIGGGYSVAPKLKTESVRLLQTFRAVLADVPDRVDRVGHDLAQFMDKLEGRSQSVSPGLSDDDAQAAAWGFGPAPVPSPVFELGSVPALPRLEMGSSDRELLPVMQANGMRTVQRSVEEVEADEKQSNIVLSELREGVYGLRLNESTVQITESTDGSITIAPRVAGDDGSDTRSFRNRVVKGLRTSLERFAGSIVREVVQFVGDAVGILMRSLIMMTVLLMVAGFILVDTERVLSWFRMRVPEGHRGLADDFIQRLDRGLSGVVRGQLFVCLFNGVLSGIGFMIFIPEYALVLAVFAAIMSLIPIFGTIISTIPAAIIGLSISPGTALAVVLWVIGVHAVEANFVSPKILSRHAKMHPVLVIFALIAGESMYGLVGALLAVPVYSVLQTVMSFVFAQIQPVLNGRR